MRNRIQFENVLKAVKYCIDTLECKPTRAKIMGLLRLEEYGGVGGDPENVGRMIDTILVGLVVDDLLIQALPVIPTVQGVISALRQRRFGNGTLNDAEKVAAILPDILAKRNIPSNAVQVSVCDEAAPNLPAIFNSQVVQLAQQIQDKLQHYSVLLSKSLADHDCEARLNADLIIGNIRRDSEITNAANRAEAEDALSGLSACIERIKFLETEAAAAKNEVSEATGKNAFLLSENEASTRRIEALTAEVTRERSRADRLEASIDLITADKATAAGIIVELREQLTAERSRADRAEGQLAATKPRLRNGGKKLAISNNDS